MEELKFLEEQGVNPRMIEEVRMYREEFPVDEAVRYRVVRPLIPFYGKEILEMAIAALLQGGKSASDRFQGHREKRAGGKPGLYFQPAVL